MGLRSLPSSSPEFNLRKCGGTVQKSCRRGLLDNKHDAKQHTHLAHKLQQRIVVLLMLIQHIVWQRACHNNKKKTC
jgi:hypothetical protein